MRDVGASPGETSKELYRAAPFEAGKSRMAERIAKAEWTLALRGTATLAAGRTKEVA